MTDAGPSSQQEQHFPPGARAPTAAAREEARVARLRDPAHLDRLNAGLAAYKALPQEEKDRRSAEKAAKRAAKEARRRATQEAVAASSPGGAPDSAPPTVRSQRTSLPSPEIPHRSLMQPKGLLDLVAALPELGLGEVFIQVQRVKPLTAFNVPCAGVQKPLWKPCDDAEFQDIYGGAEYTLKGYKHDANGIARPITDPVTYKVPGHPNLESMLTEEDVMRPATHPLRSQNPGNGHPLRHPGMMTPAAATAEADIFRTQLEHNEEMDTRERADRDRARRERADLERGKRDTELEHAKLLTRQHEAELERMERLQAERGGGLGEALQLIEKIRPGEDAAQLARQHSSEIKQLSESHKQEVLRLADQHREELTRLQTTNQEAIKRVEDNAREDRRRSEDQVRGAEQRGADVAREAQTTADRRVNDAITQARSQYEDLKTRGEERLRDQNEQWARRFEDQKEAHRRDIDAKVSEINLMRANMEGSHQMLLGIKDGEIKRLQSELRLSKDEAERNKDWMGRMSEFKENAEALGYQQGGGEGEAEDLKTTVLKAAIGQLGKLPEMIKAGTDAIQAVRGIPPAPQQQMQRGMPQQHPRALQRGRGPAPVQLQAPLVFASEDDDYVPAMTQGAPLPQIPVHAAMGSVPSMPPPPPPQQQTVFGMPMYEGPPAPPAALPPVAQQPAPQAQQQLVPQPVAETMVAPPAVTQQPALAPLPASPVAAPSDMDPMMVTILETWAPILTQAFDAGASPDVVVNGIIAENPETMPLVRSAMKTATVDQAIRFLMQNPGQHQALLSRNGQRFLRGLWASLEKSGESA